MPENRTPFAHGRTLFEDHTHQPGAHRHDLGEVAFPRGLITLWYGATTAVPAGWAICDGANGTPDLRGRVPVGVDTGQAEFDTLGEAGGAKTHTLSEAEMPVHTHVQNNHTHGLNARPDDATSTGSWFNTAVQTTQGIEATLTAPETAINQNAGSGNAHSILQPYRALHFVMKL